MRFHLLFPVLLVKQRADGSSLPQSWCHHGKMDSTKEFRNEYGTLMVREFRDLCREELGRHGMAGLARLWLRAFLDLAVTALAERSSGSPDDKEVIVNKRKLAGA